MTAKREAIFAAVEARLAAISGVGEVARMSSGDPSRWPALFIEDGGQTVNLNTEPGLNRYELTVSIDGFVEGGDGASAHADANALYLSVIAALFDGQLLGGLAEQIDEADLRMQSAHLADARRIGFSLDIKITFVAAKAAPIV